MKQQARSRAPWLASASRLLTCCATHCGFPQLPHTTSTAVQLRFQKILKSAAPCADRHAPHAQCRPPSSRLRHTGHRSVRWRLLLPLPLAPELPPTPPLPSFCSNCLAKQALTTVAHISQVRWKGSGPPAPAAGDGWASFISSSLHPESGRLPTCGALPTRGVLPPPCAETRAACSSCRCVCRSSCRWLSSSCCTSSSKSESAAVSPAPAAQAGAATMLASSSDSSSSPFSSHDCHPSSNSDSESRLGPGGGAAAGARMVLHAVAAAGAAATAGAPAASACCCSAGSGGAPEGWRIAPEARRDAL